MSDRKNFKHCIPSKASKPPFWAPHVFFSQFWFSDVGRSIWRLQTLTSAKTAMHFTKQTEGAFQWQPPKPPKPPYTSRSKRRLSLKTVITAQASTALKEILTTSPCKYFYRTTMKRMQSLGGMEGGLRMSATAGPTGLSINPITLLVSTAL